MAPCDILEEHARCQDLGERDLAWLRDRGVPPSALIKTALGAWSVVARDEIVFDGTRFEFGRHAHDGDSVGAFVWPAFNEFNEVVDIIGWRPPGWLAIWRGAVGLAGEEMVSAARFGEPLRVHADVLSWLRAGREGVCIVDPVRAAPLLRQAGRLAVGSVGERRKLEALLTVRAPRIEVTAQLGPKLTVTVREMETAL